MSIRKQLVNLLLTASIPGLCRVLSARAENAASIQATAHIEAPLGLTETVEDTCPERLGIEPGSHLYWLYYPREEGVVLQLSRSSRHADGRTTSSDVVRLYPEMLRIYPQAALVNLDGADMAVDGDSAFATLTVIFANN
jgi:hypothetical protein